MIKNRFAERLQYLLRQSNTKNSILAKAVQYDLSYISKWLSGKMMPSEKNADEVIGKIAACILQSDVTKLLVYYRCERSELEEKIREDLKSAYELSRNKKRENIFYESLPLTDLVSIIEEKTKSAKKTVALIDLFSLPHENRLVLAGIKNGVFTEKYEDHDYRMVINMESDEVVYDSIFLIHLLTSMSSRSFYLYNNPAAAGKLISCTDESAVSAIILPDSKEGVMVNILADGEGVSERIGSILNQENLIFKESTLSEMLTRQEYLQTLISTNLRWLLGHVTEQLLPADVFDELLIQEGMEEDEHRRLNRLSTCVLCSDISRCMIYESAISNLVVNGIVDFYNKPIKLKPEQIIRCLEHLEELIDQGAAIKMIDGGFSEDFRYLTNPCMFLSDATCYVRLENTRYEDNILVLNDRKVKEMFGSFFETVWAKRQDVVSENKEQIKNKLKHYKQSVKLLVDFLSAE